MDNIKMTWVANNRVKSADRSLPILQVYTWIFTADKRILIVSKDGKNWQLPGGKPAMKESLVNTAIREVIEETGLDLTGYKEGLIFFGYYIVEDTSRDKDNKVLQIRYYCDIPGSASDIVIGVDREDQDQLETEKIKFVKTTTIEQATELIPWLKSAGEFTALIELNKIRA